MLNGKNARTYCNGMACMVLMVLGGCKGSDMTQKRDWKTVVISEGSGAAVVVYSPPYGGNAGNPDEVTVLWNAKIIFDGTLPERKAGPDGMPLTLLEIRCDPGVHILEVRSGRRTHKQTVQLDTGQRHCYKIFGIENGTTTLVKDLGNAPAFR